MSRPKVASWIERSARAYEYERAARRRRLGNVVAFAFALSIVALCALTFTGCGDNLENEMLRKRLYSSLFYTVGGTAGPIPVPISLTVTIPDHRLAYALQCYARPQQNVATPTPYPNSQWGAVASAPPVSWDIRAQSADPNATTQYASIHSGACPDGWEDSGSFAGLLNISVTTARVPWRVSDDTGHFPLVTVIFSAEFGPAPGACFDRGEYDMLLGQASLVNHTQAPPVGLGTQIWPLGTQ